MTRFHPHRARFFFTGLVAASLLIVSSCGYHFSGVRGNTPFPPDIKTIVIDSATNNTIVTGIETELTDGLRNEFALGSRLEPVRSGGDVVLNTVIASYEDNPATYKADGKELTRIGTLRVASMLERPQSKKRLWQKSFSSSYSYLVTDSISGTLTNRRRAISRMIKDIIVRIHRSLYDNF
ncbi:MAG: LPS assembly lipoprotein LptE [Deltaproteobacteria bacterium]